MRKNQDLTPYRLLAVFAHPDDESLACGGLLAWCAELGARVSVVCMTRGELGRGGHEQETPSRDSGRRSGLADIRTRELEAAARILGVRDVVMLDYQDGMLPWADAARLESDIQEVLRRLGPDVVVTFGEDGLYWHPDHIAIHERTTAAVAALRQDAPVLYYVTMAAGRMRAVVETVLSKRPHPRAAQTILGIADVDAFGAAATPPTLVIETGAFAVRKLAALRCHRSQLANDALDLLSDDEATRLLGTECFRRASVGSTGAAFIERLASPAALTQRSMEQ